MPKCLFRYQWVKLPRTHLPVGKGIMGYWAKLASRAAFRKGRAKYCGYTNDVIAGDVVRWCGRLEEHSGRQKPHGGSGNHGYAQPVRVYPLHA